MKAKWIILPIIMIMITGCIWIDDDDDACCTDYREQIIYVNRTGYDIENFIDDEFVGAVAPNTSLHVYGYDYDGYHIYYSRCINCDLEWGPTEFYVDDGETFTIYLEYPYAAQTRPEFRIQREM